MIIETKTKTGNPVTIENVAGTSKIKGTIIHPKLGKISGIGKWGELAMCPKDCTIARCLWSNGDLCSAEYQDERGTKALAADLLDHHREWYFVPKERFETARKQEQEKRAKQKAAQEAEEKRVAAIFAKARETGEKQELHRFPIDCTDPGEECNVDIVTVWAMPDGSKSETKYHTW